MTPTPFGGRRPRRMPRLLLAKSSATNEGSGSATATPVGIVARPPAGTTSGSGRQALRSSPAEPGVARCGREAPSRTRRTRRISSGCGMVVPLFFQSVSGNISKVFGQAFFKKLAGCGVEPRSAAKRQENGQQRGAGGPESAARARAQAERARGTVKFSGQAFFEKLAGRGVPVARE